MDRRDRSAKARLEKATNYMGGGVHDALRVLVIIRGGPEQMECMAAATAKLKRKPRLTSSKIESYKAANITEV